MRWPLLSVMLLVGCSPVGPTPHADQRGTTSYPRVWLERQAAASGYDCLACHTALDRDMDRNH